MVTVIRTWAFSPALAHVSLTHACQGRSSSSVQSGAQPPCAPAPAPPPARTSSAEANGLKFYDLKAGTGDDIKAGDSIIVGVGGSAMRGARMITHDV